MLWLWIAASLAKIAVMFGFVLTTGGVLTWNDRRMSAMMQDRVGPNRATVVVSRKLGLGLLALSTILLLGVLASWELFGRQTPCSNPLDHLVPVQAAIAAAVIVVAALAARALPASGFRLRFAGLLHTVADGIKMIFKEDTIPKKADRWLHALAPMLALSAPLLVCAAIPFGDSFCLEATPAGQLHLASEVGRAGQCTSQLSIPLLIANTGVGVLLVFAASALGAIGVAISGLASNNKYSLLGSMRAMAQVVSYEVTLGLTLVGAMIVFGTLRLDDMVRWQGEHAWGLFVQPVAFVLFFVAATAESKRIPFDLPEGESEILGYFTEYSGMKFGMFFFAEYVEVVTSSALLVTVFLGGWNLPFLHRDGITLALGQTTIFQLALPHIVVQLLQIAAFFGKVLAVCALQAVVRWTLPRFRYDQVMRLGWSVLLPLSLANLIVAAFVIHGAGYLPAGWTLGLEFAGGLTQLLTALAILSGLGLAIAAVCKGRKPVPRTLSSSAVLALAARKPGEAS